MSTEVEQVEGAGALATTDEAALAAAVKGQVDTTRLILPNVKLTQALTAEVVDDQVSPGHFFNTLTQFDYGDSIEFVVCGLFHGYFHRTPDGDAFAARGDVVPSHWPDEYADRRFDELEDTEENFRDLVNANEREWGSGPPISTTYNFVGLIVGDETPLPVRVSMMRGNTPSAQKMETLISVGRSPWDRSFLLRAEKRMSKRSEPFYGIGVAQGGGIDPETRQAAVNVATQFIEATKANTIELAGDEDDGSKKTRRKATGAKKGSGLGM